MGAAIPIPNPMALGVDESTLPGGAGWEAANLLPIQKNRKTGQWAWGMPKSLADAIAAASAPGNAAMGNYRLMIDQMTGENYFDGMARDATGLAGLLTLGGGAIPKAPNTLGIFGGKMAATADKAALAQAEKMAAGGASRDDIWNATGWFKGADDKWRFEIPDDKSFYRSLPTPDRPPGDTVGRQLIHEALFSAYPEFRDIGLMQTGGRDRFGLKGTFSADFDNPAVMADAQINLHGMDKGSTVLHELQHAAQTVEGFATGGNQVGLVKGTPAWDIYLDVLDKVRTPLTREQFKAQIGEFPDYPYEQYIKEHKANLKANGAQLDRMAQETAVEQAYKRSAGEVEARNVQARQNLTPEQRRAKAPWLTQDVPDDRQIVRVRGN